MTPCRQDKFLFESLNKSSSCHIRPVTHISVSEVLATIIIINL